MSRPSPMDLWQQAGGDRVRYRELLVEHGHLVPGPPEPLPCGWMPGARRDETWPEQPAGDLDERLDALETHHRVGRQCTDAERAMLEHLRRQAKAAGRTTD